MREIPNNMDSFYEENAQFTSQNLLKRPLTLDLNPKGAKRQRYNHSLSTTPAVLNSPDLHMLKLASPELEKFILNNNLQTPTPSSLTFPVRVTSEQEDYVKGFEEALHSLHNSEVTLRHQPLNSLQLANSMNGGGITYTNLDDSYSSVTIKDEPQTVPNSPPLSPIDMENQEKIKLERKRQRNRVAASKCRKRKLERISKLEDKVKNLKGENVELGSVVLNLKDQIYQLKQKVMEHINAGCQVALKGYIPV